MSRNDQHMEDLFRTGLGSYKLDPSPGLWQKVHSKILWKQFLTFSFQTFNVYYLAAVVLLAGIGAYTLLSDRKIPLEEHSTPVQTEVSTGVSDESIPDVQDISKATQAADRATSDTEKTEISDKNPTRENQQNIGKTSGIAESKQEIERKDPKKPVDVEEETPGDQSGKKSDIVRVNAGFSADLLSGCSPLAVSFKNLSENAVKYNWIFSDGGSSTEKDPSYVFDEPGEYPVELRIIGQDGLEYLARQTIQVFETPKALFEMDEAVDLSSSQPVYFYNYSRGADFFEWDFGDENRSSLAEPIHYYEHPGSYNIKLTVWTGNQCYDSLVILNAFTGPESDIRFPNVFTPNMTGPTGGYYEINDISNTIFHPVVSGELIEYQMKIFSRQGMQIFESNDIHTGWDGYYQEKLAAQAVYIWKARGKFSNGKTFVKSGDVMLIRQH